MVLSHVVRQAVIFLSCETCVLISVVAVRYLRRTTQSGGKMTIVLAEEVSEMTQPALGASTELENRLRRFRARELAHRQRPTRVRIWSDGMARLGLMIAGYCGMLLLAHPLDMVAACVFAVGTISMLGSWFHDGVHKTIRHPLATVLKYVGAAPVGFSGRWWRLKHLRLHHRYPGDPTFDPDIQFGYVARVTPLQPWRPKHSTQYLHMWMLYPLSTLNILKPEEPRVARRYAELIGLGNRTPGWLLLVDKYAPFTLVWAPLLFSHSGLGALRLFLTFHLVTGTLTALITQVQHNTALSNISNDCSGRFPLCDQLLRTADVGRAPGLWWWLCGGVNLHVVHHLAPTLTFFELPAVTMRLRAELEEAGVELPTHEGLWAAVRSHAKLLRDLSQPGKPS
jgi:linoleoyl-CoA desaturase